MSTYNDSALEKPMFDPKNLPDLPTPVFDVSGRQIGTFNPHTLVIHPTSSSPYGPLKLLGSMAFNTQGKLVGNFNAEGKLRPVTEDETASSA